MRIPSTRQRFGVQRARRLGEVLAPATIRARAAAAVGLPAPRPGYDREFHAQLRELRQALETDDTATADAELFAHMGGDPDDRALIAEGRERSRRAELARRAMAGDDEARELLRAGR